MPNPDFIVQPQRSDGRGYVPCEVHRATSWAVVRVQKFTQKGRKFTASRVIARCGTKNQAEGLAQSNLKSFAPTPRELIRKLGRRIISS
jgi:hypothetical protein